MRVCVVTTAFPRWKGDGEAPFLWESVHAIAQQGVQVRVIAMHSPGVSTRDCIDGIEVIRPRYWWPERWEALRKAGHGGLPATLQKYPYVFPQLIPFGIVHILSILRFARDCDLLHSHWTLSAAAACVARRIYSLPLVSTVHGSDIFQVTRHPVGALMTRRILQCCDHITAVSRALMESTVALGVDSEKVDVVSNGVDIDRFVPGAEDRDDIVLFVGSLIERKGAKYLIAAMQDVVRKFPSCRLVLIGEGPLRSSLSDLTRKLGLEQHVTFLRFRPQEEVRGWMQRARLLVLPSLEEAQGVVLLEALACGTPIVASQVDGIPEVVTPDVGLLVPPSDSVAISDAIQQLLGDHRRWRGMSRQARRRAETRYSWNRTASQFVSIYRSVAGHK